VAISPDGQFVAAGRANQIFLYHVPTKRLVGRLTDPALLKSGIYENPGVSHLDLVQSLRFSPDSQLLASGGYRTAKFWERTHNARKLEIAGLESPPKSVAASDDGKWVAIGEETGKIRLIELATGKLTRTLEGHSAAVSGLAFSVDGKQLVSGSQDNSCRLWNVDDGTTIGTITTPVAVNAVALVNEDTQIASGGADNIIRIWALPAAPSPQPDAAAAPAEDKPAEDNPQEDKADEKPEVEAPPAPIRELKGHGGPVTSLVAFADKKLQLLSGSQDATARVWDVAGGKQVRSMNHGGPVTAVAVRPDGSRFTSAGQNNVAKLWDAKGKQLAELKGDFRKKIRVDDVTRAVSLAKREIDATKTELKTVNDRKTAEEKNAKTAEDAQKKATEELTKKEEETKKPVEAMQAAEKTLADAKTLMTSSETAKKASESNITKAAESMTQATAAFEAAKKAMADAEKAIADALVAKTKAEESKKKADTDLAKATADIKAGEAAVKKAKPVADKAISARDAAKKSLESSERTAKRAKESVAKVVASIPAAEAIVKKAEEAHKLVEGSLEGVKKEATDSEMAYYAIAFSPDGLTVATGGDDQTIRTWDAETGAAIDTFTGHASVIRGLVFTPGLDVLSIAENKSVYLWDTNPEWTLTRTIGTVDSTDQLADRVTALDFSPDGLLLATGSGEPSRSGEMKIWNVADGKLVLEIKEPHSDTIFGLEFSPDGKQIASCGADRFAKIFELETGKFIRSFEGHTHHVLGVSWRADGRRLATSGADNVIKVWDIKTGDQKRTISGFGKEVTSIRFVADGDNVLACSGDKTVQMKNAESGGNVRNFPGAVDFMYAVSASASGKVIAAGGQDSVLRVWGDNGKTLANFEKPADPDSGAE
jgi:WD40 repeat protein